MNQQIVLGGGCFWCLEALYSNVRGVSKVISGYAGGQVPNPTYEQVSSGSTSHAEVVQITFDSSVISLNEILAIFFGTHNPTTLNQQGADVGSQYRSIILYKDKNQQDTAKTAIIDAQKLWDSPIITEVKKLKTFYVAEKYHQNYFALNPEKAYCQLVINPKLVHFRQNFHKYLKP